MITAGQTQKAIAEIKQTKALIDQLQSTYDIGTPEWNALETIDDRLFATLQALGD